MNRDFARFAPLRAIALECIQDTCPSCSAPLGMLPNPDDLNWEDCIFRCWHCNHELIRFHECGQDGECYHLLEEHENE